MIVELYGEADLQRLRRRVKGWIIALCSFSAAALAACIVLAALTNTANARRMELTAIIVSIIAGWIVVYCSCFIAAAGKRELEHAKMLTKEERTRIAGTPVVTDQRVAIRKSITARRVEVEGERLLVCESRAKSLEGAKAVYAAHGYIAAYER